MNAKKVLGSFDDLIDLATKFVDQQGGKWDHSAWLEFLSEIQKNGYNLSHDMQSYLGSMLESLKKIYGTVTATSKIENIMLGVSENTIDFIKTTKGMWDHNNWESFLKGLQTKGLQLNEETTTYVGGVLEAAKELYSFPLSSKKEKEK
ncbi:MAG: hypothetical protein HQK89_13510 [Nitrospirae bacterium]|nr:hypothetical protein [Nitrospirota bacterium]